LILQEQLEGLDGNNLISFQISVLSNIFNELTDENENAETLCFQVQV
jgi:hypothetical protein